VLEKTRRAIIGFISGTKGRWFKSSQAYHFLPLFPPD
jgi:hypothetical protein